MNIINEPEELFCTLQDIKSKIQNEGFLERKENFVFKLDENYQTTNKKIFISKIIEQNVEYGVNISVTIHEDDSELMTFSITNFDEYEFKKNVHQPFGWDGDNQERFAQNEFLSFLADKDLSDRFEILIIKNNQTLKYQGFEQDDSEEIDKILQSIDFDNLLDSALYGSQEKNTHKKFRI